MSYHTPVPFETLVKETIVKVEFGNPALPTLGSYGARTIHTQSGRIFAVWQAFGEVNLSEILPDKS